MTVHGQVMNEEIPAACERMRRERGAVAGKERQIRQPDAIFSASSTQVFEVQECGINTTIHVRFRAARMAV